METPFLSNTGPKLCYSASMSSIFGLENHRGRRVTLSQTTQAREKISVNSNKKLPSNGREMANTETLQFFCFSKCKNYLCMCANLLHHILCCELFGSQIFFEVSECNGLKLCDRALLSESSHSHKVLQTREIYKANTTLDPNNNCLFFVYVYCFSVTCRLADTFLVI